ncbi:MAG: alpha/beta fold hydrolase [Chloroflexota bacterium]
MKYIISTAEPFFFPGSRTGVLLIHGFTGAPKEMRKLGEFLHREYNFTVLGIRLSAHATQPEDMIRSAYQDWLASVEDGYCLLKDNVDKLFVMGLSMGGVLALRTASLFPFAGVVAMSTPFKLPDDPRLRHIEWLSKIASFIPKGSGEPGDGWFDKTAAKTHVSYPQNPLHAIGELNKLIHEMQTSLPLINVPVLLVHSHDDDYVFKESMPSIFENLGTSKKEMVWIEGSGHVITEDAGHEKVFKLAGEFVNRLSQ